MDEETGSQHDKALQDIAAALGIPVADLIAREYDSGPTPRRSMPSSRCSALCGIPVCVGLRDRSRGQRLPRPRRHG